jgi:c-di-GMP phosphodiesterase
MPSPHPLRAAVVLACTLAFAAVAYAGAERFVEARNRSALGEISETALRYVELAVVSAGTVLEDVARTTPVDCGTVSLQGVRLRVYEHSVIKDVRTLTHDGAVRCAAYAETLEFDRDWPARPAMLPTRDGSLRLFRVQQFTSDALGVFKDVDGTRALAAIVSIDPLQLDLLPAPLRTLGRVSLELANGETVAASDTYAPPAADAVSLARASAAYPIQIGVSVPRDALRAWNGVPLLPLLGGAGLLGAFFGLLLARLVGRPLDAAQSLDAALRARAFRPYYQPIFALADRRIVGCEMLMRWVLPDGRIVPPSAFIPLAESTGRIEAMTWQVLREALSELREAMAADPGFRLSFNVVPRHFMAPGFAADLARVVREAGVAPAQIVLELTERDAFDDAEAAGAVVRGLRADGFRVALDDVGVGHSGLSHIQSLRPDTLKVDKFFVDALGADATANVVIDMLVRLAAELGMSVVAEGVETEAQLAALRGCGVDRGQGYLVSPPVPLAAFRSLIAAPATRCAAAA